MKVKDIVLIGMMSAVLFTVQVALSFIPNVELISILIILCTLFFKWKTLYIIYSFVIAEGFIYGFGLWWINYLYIWTVLFFITMLFHKQRFPYFWAILSGIFGLSFGALCSIPYFFMGGIPSMVAYWTSGIIFDLIHGVSNYVLALVLFQPLYRLMEWLLRKWEFVS